MYTALVIGAALLIVIALTAGLALLFDDDGVRQPAPRPERRNVDPQPFVDWGGTIGNDQGSSA